MSQESIIQKTANMVRSRLSNEPTGHDWHHIERVVKTAKRLAVSEGADEFVVTLAALLHDLADDKVVENEAEGLQNIASWLADLEVNSSHIDHVLHIIKTVSFRGGNGKQPETIEGQVVQDADRLDAIGAIGIARCFVYSGSKGIAMYNPDLPVRKQMTVEEYRNGESSAIHHFYEKLLKLKDLMNTKSGYALAMERHAFMETFLEQFYKEMR